MTKAESSVYGLLGLSVRAGQVSFGEDGCLRAVRGGTCGLLLIDGGASENARKRYTDACGFHQTPLAMLSPGLLERATGKKGRIAAAVAKGGFAESMCKVLDAGIPKSGIERKKAKNCGGASVE